jgi:hypothetical protein
MPTITSGLKPELRTLLASSSTPETMSSQSSRRNFSFPSDTSLGEEVFAGDVGRHLTPEEPGALVPAPRIEDPVGRGEDVVVRDELRPRFDVKDRGPELGGI